MWCRDVGSREGRRSKGRGRGRGVVSERVWRLQWTVLCCALCVDRGSRSGVKVRNLMLFFSASWARLRVSFSNGWVE